MPKLLVFVALFICMNCSPNVPDRISFAGNWVGDGKVIVSWCEQKTIAFELTVSKGGRVRGKVGDAEFVNGYLESNVFWLKILGNPDYIINGDLKGYLIDEEKIKRKKGKFIVNISSKEISGGFRTSGTKTGGKKSMVFTDVNVNLHKK
jgi:hypothetical protein